MITFLDLLVVALAIGGAVDVWFNSVPTAGLLAKADKLADSTNRFSWFGKLLACPYCLSHHVGWLALLFLLIGRAAEDNGFVSCLFLAMPYWLAAVRLSLLINAVLPKHLQYDGRPPVISDVDLELLVPQAKATHEPSASDSASH